ncbi:TerB family tellurite resistance protein [Chitinophaga lutea]|uniref:TerB family tellurite resistance protein n=1 Tax=Chitinophaga lutea TaxID=2488634 RepID=A0A3N4Q6M3_9BACT|nr:TerB family tellurite resistance protein [Chitinophaga lutea]
MLCASSSARAQSTELQQLALNIEKLAQLRSILNNMYRGYQIISRGYTTVKDISEGNFSMHRLFLDGLLAVSPTVRRYHKIAAIITMQQQIWQTYSRDRQRLRTLSVFSAGDIDYCMGVYSTLLDQSLRHLEDLLMVTTAGKLRMSDAERIAAIDRVFTATRRNLDATRQFSDHFKLAAAQRQAKQDQYLQLKKHYRHESH